MQNSKVLDLSIVSRAALLAGLAALGALVLAMSGPQSASANSDELGGDGGQSSGKPPKLDLETYSGHMKLLARGVRDLGMTFRFKGDRKNVHIRVAAVHKGKKQTFQTWDIPDAEGGKKYTIAWKAGRAGGGPAPSGDYVLKVREVGRGTLRRGSLPSPRKVQVKHYMFPITKPGSRITFGDGWGAGRNHKGADAFAPCGRKMVSARAGKVVFRAHQSSGAGHYVVIRGKEDGRDLVYMHLKKKASVKNGDSVKAGQKIGLVGETGNANGCHLHFESWRGKWYDGGKAHKEALKLLKRWHGWYKG